MSAVAQTPSHLRHTRHPLDTPTPAPSTGHTSGLITSLKPARSRSNMSQEFQQQQQQNPLQSKQYNLSSLNNNKYQFQQALQSRLPLGHTNGRSVHPIPEINTEDLLDLDNLEIDLDNTERERRSLEAAIRRGMGELAASDTESEREDENSIGFGDLSDAESRAGRYNEFSAAKDLNNFRARIEDESESSESVGDDFSVQAPNPTNYRQQAQQVHQPQPRPQSRQQEAVQRVQEDDDVLSYISVSRSVSPSSPNRNASAPVSHGIAQEFHRAQAVNISSRSPLGNIQNTMNNNTRGAAPASSRVHLPDVTGLTEGLISPAKARNHYAVPKPSTASSEGALLSSALGDLRKRLNQLERENSILRSQQRELTQAPTAGTAPQANQNYSGLATRETELRLAEEEKRRENLENELVRLRAHVAHLSKTLETQSATVTQLKSSPRQMGGLRDDVTIRAEVAALRIGLDDLGSEFDKVKIIVENLWREKEQGAEWEREEFARRQSMNPSETSQLQQQNDPDKTPRPKTRHVHRAGPETPESVKGYFNGNEISRLQAELKRREAKSPTPRTHKRRTTTTAPIPQTHHQQHDRAPASVASHHSYEESLASSAVPHAQFQRQTHSHKEPHPDFQRAEAIFRNYPGSGPSAKGYNNLCSQCHKNAKREKGGNLRGSAPAKMMNSSNRGWAAGWEGDDELERLAQAEAEWDKQEKRRVYLKEKAKREKIEAKSGLQKILKELENDFESHKKIYIELSEQYRAMDSKLAGAKRKVLAEHLKESIDILESKAEQVKRLHDFLHHAH